MIAFAFRSGQGRTRNKVWCITSRRPRRRGRSGARSSIVTPARRRIKTASGRKTEAPPVNSAPPATGGDRSARRPRRPMRHATCLSTIHDDARQRTWSAPAYDRKIKLGTISFRFTDTCLERSPALNAETSIFPRLVCSTRPTSESSRVPDGF